VSDKAVIPAYLGWGNGERDRVQLRLYATDDGDAPRWDERFQGGRVVEYAVAERFGPAEGDRFLVVRVAERFGPAEGDRFLVVRVGDRFTTDEVMHRVAQAVVAALVETADG
jgi:hypothetical protein